VDEAEIGQQLGDRAFGIDDAEAILDHLLQIAAPPTHDPVAVGVRPGIDDLGQLPQLIAAEPAPTPRRRPVHEPLRAVPVEAMHPVAKRLPVHAADPGRVAPAHPVTHRRQRQQTAALMSIPGTGREPSQLAR
jgi:hypothetical protein